MSLAVRVVLCPCRHVRRAVNLKARARTQHHLGSQDRREAPVAGAALPVRRHAAHAQAASLCPPRQPELLALETECAHDEPAECSTTPAPMGETTAETAEAGNAATTTTTTEAAAAAGAGSTEAPTADGAPRQARRQRKRTCNYHLCVLKKIEVLDSSDMPEKTLFTNWIANNVTDENQREKLQQRFTECVSSLKDIFGEASDNSKSTEEDTTDDKKNEETQPKKKSCVTAKKVISCLSKSVECPVLKF